MDMVKRGDMMNIDDTIDILASICSGWFLMTRTSSYPATEGEPAVTEENSMAGQAYRNIARRLLGEKWRSSIWNPG